MDVLVPNVFQVLLFTHARPPGRLPIRYHPSPLALVHDGGCCPRFLVIGVIGARVVVVLSRFVGAGGARDDRFGRMGCQEIRLRATPWHEVGFERGKRDFGHRYGQDTGGENGHHGYRNLF
ncbi:hypothetical protein CRG98_034800 [Punica granatum]|uniref:Uncharacterized protein n=1 Tax=Punica granatum TaxID=22663 RepID=A0A2I0ILH8_PUNGR|nr:hypothetical protein CRG98_034800 [Punica granatum]